MLGHIKASEDIGVSEGIRKASEDIGTLEDIEVPEKIGVSEYILGIFSFNPR